MSRYRAASLLLSLLACAPVLSGCSTATITKHGQQFRETDLQAVQAGMSQDQVRTALGTPATTAIIGDGKAYYYVSSTDSQKSFFLPTEESRQVVAVYFNSGGTVDTIANYGLKDGKVFDFISRTTPAPGGKDEGILKGLFRNLGKQQLFGNG
jgi:outer membrane protein assembly factor BamE (lipoprotein component of BamABCDE complex)